MSNIYIQDPNPKLPGVPVCSLALRPGVCR